MGAHVALRLHGAERDEIGTARVLAAKRPEAPVDMTPRPGFLGRVLDHGQRLAVAMGPCETVYFGPSAAVTVVGETGMVCPQLATGVERVVGD